VQPLYNYAHTSTLAHSYADRATTDPDSHTDGNPEYASIDAHTDAPASFTHSHSYHHVYYHPDHAYHDANDCYSHGLTHPFASEHFYALHLHTDQHLCWAA
jgi:hypothetical protein